MKLTIYATPDLHGLKNIGHFFKLPSASLSGLPDNCTLIKEIDLDVDEAELTQVVQEWRESYIESKQAKRDALLGQIKELDL